MYRMKAEHLLPVFVNLWFDELKYVGPDSCGIEYSNFEILLPSPAAVLQTKAPYYSDCLWDYSNLTISSNSTNPPPGFVSANYDDWNQIILDPNAIVGSSYSIACIDNNGKAQQYFYDWIYPFYDCPPYTRLSYDNTTLEKGCTTTPTLCLADVVARDLSIPGMETFGHIGLVSSFAKPNAEIIEVLNDAIPGIYSSRLYGSGSFQEKSNYWGTRFGLKNVDRMPVWIAANIIYEAQYQQTACDGSFKYSYLWDYYPAYTKDIFYERCKFRCDSFVYYCYESNGFKIQETFSFPTSPNTIYFDLLCGADPVLPCLSESAVGVVNKPSNYSLKALEVLELSVKNTTNAKAEILNNIVYSFSDKKLQTARVDLLLNQYFYQVNAAAKEFFVRWLCFYLMKFDANEFNFEVKDLLLDIFLQYQFLSLENFMLSMLESELAFHMINPMCNWLNVYFSIKTENENDKELAMINYIDHQSNIIDRANLVSASRLGSLKSLTTHKKCEYGSFFHKAYNHDKSINEKERKILWLALAEMQYPHDETLVRHSFCK